MRRAEPVETNEALCARAKAGDGRAAAQLIAQNSGLVTAYARKWAQRLTSLDVEDLVSEGRIGLVIAIERFDPAHGVKFVTYAYNWVKHCVRRAAELDSSSLSGVKAKIVMNSRAYHQACERAEAQHGSLSAPQAVDALAREFGVHREGIEGLRTLRRRMASMDAPIGNDEATGTLHDLIGSDDDAMALVEMRERVDAATAVVDSMHLDRRQRAILDERITGEASLQELAERFGCSRERIRQVEAQLIERLRGRLSRFTQPSQNGSAARSPGIGVPATAACTVTESHEWQAGIGVENRLVESRVWSAPPTAVPAPITDPSPPATAPSPPTVETVAVPVPLLLLAQRFRRLAARAPPTEPAAALRPVATRFSVMLAVGASRGYLALVAPTTARERVAEERTIRDAEESQACARCGAPSRHYRCDECREHHRLATNARRETRRQAGLCIFCGAPFPCERCADRCNETTSRIRSDRREHGLCELCGAPEERGGYCAKHRAPRLKKAIAREAKRRSDRKGEGLCVRCGKEPATAPRVRCSGCLRIVLLQRRARKQAATILHLVDDSVAKKRAS